MEQELDKKTEMSITAYLAHFKSVFGVIAMIGGSFPFVALLPTASEFTTFFFPPLGDQTLRAQTLTLIAVFLIVLLTYFLSPIDCFKPKKNRAKFLSSLVGVSLLSTMLYLGLSQAFVVKIDIPSESKTVYLSTGYNYTENVQNSKIEVDTEHSEEGLPMLEASDEEKIRMRGLSDEDLKWIWTSSSLNLVRFFLWLTYFIFILSLVSIGSFAVYFDLAQLLENGEQLKPGLSE